MKENKRISQPNRLTPAETRDPVGEINKIRIAKFNELCNAIYGVNQIYGTSSDIKTAKDDLADKFSSVMERTGVALTACYLPNYKFFDLQFKITEPEKTIGFLKTIDDTPDENTKKSMALLVQSIFGQINYAYSRKKGPNNEIVDLALGLDDFIKEFARMSIQTQQMEEYLMHANSLTLKDYVTVVKSGILVEQEETENAPLSEWHLSMHPSKLSKAWHRAIAVLDKIGENPLAAELYEDVLMRLEFSIEDALDEAKRNEEAPATIDVLLLVKEILDQYRSSEEN